MDAQGMDEARRCLARGGHVHLMGVGGVGVAGLAHLLIGRGCRVSGCDLELNRCAQSVAAAGGRILAGHDPSHLVPPPDWLICSAAVPADHPEAAAARAAGIPVSRRGEALAAFSAETPCVAVCGTHGKTTTTAMLVQMFRHAGLDPSFAIGAEVDALGGVAAVGASPWLVVEADESDGTLALYTPEVAVVTNVDLDHLEHFRDLAEFHGVFETLVRRARRVVCYGRDDPAATRIAGGAGHAIGFGLDRPADVRGLRRRPEGIGQTFEVELFGRPIGRVRLPAPGAHNARNALGALAAAVACGLDPATAMAALEGFRAARRRLEIRVQRPDLRVVSDYAHHPAEIRALLDAVREGLAPSGLWMAFQPHRYTRTRALLREFPPAFQGVERLWLAPVYAASEPPLPGGSSKDLLEEFHRQGHRGVRLAADLEDLWVRLLEERRPGDLILLVGAGDIDRLADRAAAEWG